MKNHGYYRRLCALLPLGELDERETEKLCSHLNDCPSCRRRLGEYEQVLYNVLPLAAAEARGGSVLEFRPGPAQAEYGTSSARSPQAEPLEQPRGAVPRKRRFFWLPWAIASCLSVALLTEEIRWWRHSRELHQEMNLARGAVDELKRQLASWRASPQPREEAPAEPGVESPLPATTAKVLKEPQVGRAGRELTSAREALALERAQVKRLEEEQRILLENLDAAERIHRAERDELASARQAIEALRERAGWQLEELRQVGRDLHASRQRSGLMAHENGLLSALITAEDLKVTQIDNIINRSSLQEAHGRILSASGIPARVYLYGLPQRDDPSAEYHLWSLGRRQQLEERNGVLSVDEDSEMDSTRHLGSLELDSVERRRWSLSLGQAFRLSQARYLLVTVSSNVRPSAPRGEVLFYGLLSSRTVP